MVARNDGSFFLAAQRDPADFFTTLSVLNVKRTAEANNYLIWHDLVILRARFTTNLHNEEAKKDRIFPETFCLHR